MYFDAGIMFSTLKGYIIDINCYSVILLCIVYCVYMYSCRLQLNTAAIHL